MELGMKKFTLIFAGVLWLSANAWAAEHEVVHVSINGLSCPFCAYSVDKSISKLAGVDSVKVNLAENSVDVAMLAEHTADIDAIKRAIVNAGFTPVEASKSVAND
jgi:copper chaperone CopZ